MNSCVSPDGSVPTVCKPQTLSNNVPLLIHLFVNLTSESFYSIKKAMSLGMAHWVWGMGHWALGMAHWALGIGHWALGIGHWALGIGHWALGIGQRRDESRLYNCLLCLPSAFSSQLLKRLIICDKCSINSSSDQ